MGRFISLSPAARLHENFSLCEKETEAVVLQVDVNLVYF